TLGDSRPVVIAVDQRDGGGDATIECSGGDHAVHIAVDLARHARVAATTADSTQLGQVVIWQLAPVDQTPAQNDAEGPLVLHLRDHRTDCRQPRTADVDRGDTVGSTDPFG